MPFYRRSGEISAYEHLEHRFGAWARTYAVICYLLTQLARMGTIMYLVALALAAADRLEHSDADRGDGRDWSSSTRCSAAWRR